MPTSCSGGRAAHIGAGSVEEFRAPIVMLLPQQLGVGVKWVPEADLDSQEPP